MSKAFFQVPTPKNEPILSYAPNTPERAALKLTIEKLRNQQIDVPMYINGQEIRTGDLQPMSPPHDHQHILGHYHEGQTAHIQAAIDTALAARSAWAAMPWEHRLSIFLKAADLSAGKYRYELNAATMQIGRAHV